MTATLGSDIPIRWGTSLAAMAELGNVRDLNVELSCDAADLTPNGASGWRASTHGLRDAQITWTMIWDIADAGQQAIRDAYLNDTTLYLWISGGIAAACAITELRRDERITDAIAIQVVAKPTLGDLEPSWLSDLIDGDVGGFVDDDITLDHVQVAA